MIRYATTKVLTYVLLGPRNKVESHRSEDVDMSGHLPFECSALSSEMKLEATSHF